MRDRTILGKKDAPWLSWVVVRRAQAALGLIAVGVRGANRSERWAAFARRAW